MSSQITNHAGANRSRFRFTYLALAISFIVFISSLVYSIWNHNRQKEANLPVPGIETVVAALRTFHQQTGRFPQDFRELDERMWKGAKRHQISNDGTSLNAANSHYFYTLHVKNPTIGKNATEPPKAGVWAIPTGVRANQAATYFWYITPTDIERWMGPALTAENIGVARTIPSEQQLSLLVMTKQAKDRMRENPASNSVFKFFDW
jgi:hypothetical protein